MSEKLNADCLSNFEEISATNCDLDQLKELDNLLKCGICYDYFNTCVVTDCSHNFCSLCIRKYIQYKTECPICFSELYDSQLRANRIVDNFISIFPKVKERVVCQLRTLKTLKPNCVYVSPSKVEDFPTKLLPSISNASKTPHIVKIDNVKERPKPGYSQANEHFSSTKIIIPKMFQSPVKRNSPNIENSSVQFVTCPVCAVEIPQRNINLHLDDCLNRDKDEKRNKITSTQRKHLPKLVYSLITINALRAKVKEYGLNSQGDFETLKNRLQKYIVLYNAECDKSNPRPIQDIIRQLEKEEKNLLNQKLPKSIFNVAKDDNTAKEELNEQYLKENKDSFEKLIKSVKQRKSQNCNDVDVSQSFSENLNQPSTSKAGVNENFVDCNRKFEDWIEIEEFNIDNIKTEPLCDVKRENSDDDDDDVVSTVLQNHRQNSRRLLFDSSSDDSMKVGDRVSVKNEIESDDCVTFSNDQTTIQDEDLSRINYVHCKEQEEMVSFRMDSDPLTFVLEATDSLYKKNRPRKDTYCIYCNREVLHFSRHLERKHAAEECVMKFMAMEKGSKSRKRIIDGIRKRGNLFDYENDQVVRPVKRARNEEPRDCTDSNNLMTCENCKGIYMKHYIARHVKTCTTKEKNQEPAIYTSLEENHLLKKYRDTESHIRSVIMNNMKDDEIKRAIVDDYVILGMAETMMRRSNYQRLTDTAANHLRNLARLLVVVRKLSECKTLLDCLNSKCYNILMEAARLEAGYDVNLKKWKSKTYALNLSTTLTAGCDVASHLARLEHPEVRRGNVKTQRKLLKGMKDLIECCWKFDINNPDNLAVGVTVPPMEDVRQFLDHVYGIVSRSMVTLAALATDEKTFIEFQEAVYLSLVFWNEGRVETVRELLLESYLKSRPIDLTRDNTTPIEGEFLKAVKVAEGDENIVFTPDVRRCLDLLIELRKNFKEKRSRYLFVNLDGHRLIEGWKIVSKLAYHCGAGSYKILMMGDFRKYTTIYPHIDGIWLSYLSRFFVEFCGLAALHATESINFSKIVSILNDVVHNESGCEINYNENVDNCSDVHRVYQNQTIESEDIKPKIDLIE